VQEDIDFVSPHHVGDLLGRRAERSLDIGDFEREQLMQRPQQTILISSAERAHGSVRLGARIRVIVVQTFEHGVHLLVRQILRGGLFVEAGGHQSVSAFSSPGRQVTCQGRVLG
jgi:hypothetical protein